MPLSGATLDGPIPPATLLRRGGQSRPDAPALVSARSRYTFRELDQASSRLAAALLGLGLRPGDRVASLMPNRTELLLHYLACLKAGLVATPLNYRYTPREIDHALTVSEAAILLAHAERDADVAASARAANLPLGVIRSEAGPGRNPSLLDLINCTPPTRDLPEPDPGSPAVILFTSGSTGLPKGVTHSFATLGWMLASFIQGLECTAEDVIVTGSSLSHLAGLSLGLAALGAGARVVVPRTLDGDEVLPLLRRERPTVLLMLPAALFRLVRDHGAHREDFTSLRLCISGGDKVPAELEREFTDLTGLTIDEVYGMTEIGTTTINPPSGVNKVGSIGRLCPGYTLSIRDDQGSEVATGEEGRLWIKSPTNMVGYWGNREATEEIRDGWLDTGDVMKVDADGYLWFGGRKKQIIVHDGSNICPQEVEDALLEHPSVESAGVVGVHDLVHGENVRAYVTLKESEKPPSMQELIQFARGRVGYKAPEEVVVLERMPQTPVGKTDRTALKKMAEAGLG